MLCFFFCRFIFITALFSSSSPYCMGTSGVRHMAEWSRSGYHMDIRGKMILAACPHSVSPNKQEASAEQCRSRMGWGTFGEVVVNDLIMIDDDMVSWRCYIMTVVRSGCGEGDDTGSKKLHKSRLSSLCRIRCKRNGRNRGNENRVSSMRLRVILLLSSWKDKDAKVMREQGSSSSSSKRNKGWIRKASVMQVQWFDDPRWMRRRKANARWWWCRTMRKAKREESLGAL